MRRVCAVVLPSFRITLVRARTLLKNEPLAVVVDEARSENDLTGGTRIDEVSDEARACGVLPGSTIASARAACADLRVRVLHPREATHALESLAEMLLALGAITSPMLDRDCVLVDVTGCAHLWPGSRETGEEMLLAAIVAMVASAGFSCRSVIASGPEIAWALAKESSRSRVVKDEDTMRELADLSIDVLRLDASTASYFHRLGTRTIGALRALPRNALTARIENQNLLARARALLLGEDLTPMARFVPPQILDERAELEYGIENHEALFFVLKTLCDRMSARLAARAVLAARLVVMLELDRALCGEGMATSITVSLPLATPLRKSAELMAVLRSRFEREANPALREAPLHAPARAVTLSAPDLAPIENQSRHLFVPESRAEMALPKLTAELSALMGEDAIGTLVVADDWRIARRSVLVPFGTKWKKLGDTNSIEPLRLARAPHAEVSSDTIVLHHLARFERIVWWREPALGVRDWKLAWHDGAIAFVEVIPALRLRRDGKTHARVRGYLD